MTDHVLIIGAGFSGALFTVNLLRGEGRRRVTLIERRERAGPGLAYGSAHETHLLNVRAGNMSAFPDEPRHFADWLARRGVADAAAVFAPRLLYGDYLRELLAEAAAGSGGRLDIVHGDAVDLLLADDGVEVVLGDGMRIAADAAALALGNLPPHAPPGLDPLALGPRYFPDPWDSRAVEGLEAGDTVLIIGTGLTMVDVALMLEVSGFAGRIVAISRRGLLPQPHASASPYEARRNRPGTAAARLVADVRERAQRIGWRNAVDELRPFTQAMWRAASREEQRRFLRHLRPWWDVHRHRLAPELHARLSAMQASRQLTVAAGKLLSYGLWPDGVEVTWRLRGGDALETLRVARVINCTGPEGNLPRTSEPILRTLLARGTIRSDGLQIGIDVDEQARTIRADGTTNERLLALGPLTRGAFWEISAVPDIRSQLWELARGL